MDVEFRRVLSGAGLGNATFPDEHVLNMDIFLHLREENFERLLPKLTVGEGVSEQSFVCRNARAIQPKSDSTRPL